MKIKNIFAPAVPNNIVTASFTWASPSSIILSGPTKILIPTKYSTYATNTNIGPIIRAIGRFFLEFFISCDIEVETTQPSYEKAIGARAPNQASAPPAASISALVIILGSPYLNPAIANTPIKITLDIVVKFWKNPPSNAEK